MTKRIVACSQPILKPTKKVKAKKKPKLKDLTSLQRKADRMLQEVGRSLFEQCEVCGGEVSCLHHIFPKSTSSYLRYSFPNLVALCVGCHFSHHNGNPEPHMILKARRGDDWWHELQAERRKGLGFKPTRVHYDNIIEILSSML